MHVGKGHLLLGERLQHPPRDQVERGASAPRFFADDRASNASAYWASQFGVCCANLLTLNRVAGLYVLCMTSERERERERERETERKRESRKYFSLPKNMKVHLCPFECPHSDSQLVSGELVSFLI